MKSYTIEIKWALIFVAVTLLWMVLERLLGLHGEHIDQHAVFTNFFFIPAIAIFVLALRDKRENFYGGVMTYKQGFLAGLIITLIVTVLTPFTQWMISNTISPNYFPNMIEYVVQTNRMTRSAAENAFNTKSYIIQATVGALMMGVLTSAVLAMFMKKKISNQHIAS